MSSWSKKVTCAYLKVDAVEEGFFSSFTGSMETLLRNNGSNAGVFEGGLLKYFWKLHEKIDMPEAPLFLFSVIKEKQGWPNWFTEDAELNELPIPDGILGEANYGIVCPDYGFLICMGSASNFRKLLGQFSVNGDVILTPLLEENVDERVMDWDFFKKVSISVNMPSGDDLKAFSLTNAGKLVKMVEHLGGLKVDVSVTPGTGKKESLSSMVVKDLLPELLSNDFCKSLVVKGGGFENEIAVLEQVDLKNAQIKYSEKVVIEGNYIEESDAKQILMRALRDQERRLFA